MNENFQILYELLTKGTYSVKNKSYNLSYINQQLRILNCTAREWYDQQTLILVYTDLPIENYKCDVVNHDIALFKRLVNNESVYDDRLDYLIKNGWVVREDDNSYGPSKKFMMQFKDFILEHSRIYNECIVCKIVVKNDKEHKYCRNVREKVKKELE